MDLGTSQRAIVCLIAGVAAVASGACLSRPIEHTEPRLETTFTAVVENRAIDKIDLLFDIDNSASMGDKQAYLTKAIPDLVHRLVDPNCVDANGVPQGASDNGVCESPLVAEFAPVHDMHLGIVSSSLGSRGVTGAGAVCSPSATAEPPFANVSAHNDDHGYLLNRSLTYSPDGSSVTEGVVSDAPASAPFLYWYPTSNTAPPSGAGAPVTDAGTLIADFAQMVGGAGVFGCGIESQLESWYRFLIQPDPYESIVVANERATWSGVDPTVLRERHDFLRPDSLVAVIVLSDENDSEIDVRSLGGLAYHWMNAAEPLPRGTSACAASPGSSACQSCGQGNGTNPDPACALGDYASANDWGFDVNLRHVHMKAKYGLDPQYPIERYVTGLTSTTVPDRRGEYPAGAGSYVGTQDCQNPLFAASLPDGSDTSIDTLCHAPPGTARTPDLVFYAHIGGVPSELLHFDPTSASKSELTEADWVKILGKDPENYDYTGIDPHMIESYQPRPGVAGPGSANNADPVNGHDWITDTSDGQPGNTNGGHVLAVDREYACTFPLVDPSGNPAPRDCSLADNASVCDCPGTTGSVNAEELPPICGPIPNLPLPAGWTAPGDVTQTGAKAYPTTRELLLAKKMGKQGIVSSICPIHTADNMAGDDPLYGYRPAVAVIVDRLKNALTDQCLPESLAVQADGTVPCLILLQIPASAGTGASGTCQAPSCPAELGLSAPPPDVLANFCQSLEQTYAQQVSANGGSPAGLTDPAGVPVCMLQQLTPGGEAGARDFTSGTCASGPDPGWCYVTGPAAGACAQDIVFTKNALPKSAVSSLQCVEQSVSVLGKE